jgi:hypothetical protein
MVLDEMVRKSVDRPGMPKVSASFLDNLKKPTIIHRINMGIDEARITKDKISSLVVAKPTNPYISYGAALREATIKDPTEFFNQLYYVDVDLIEVWIYNKQSGQVLKKITSK